MKRNNAWAWSLMLVATLLFGIGLGLSLGYAFFAPRDRINMVTAAPPTDPAGPEPVETSTNPAPEPQPVAPVKIATPAVPPPVQNPDGYAAGRHLFVTINGQWLANAAKTMLAELKPGGVLLTESNLGSRAQTFALVKEIKQATGIGEGLGDLPLIAVQQEGGPYNLLGVPDAPSAETIAASGDPEIARRLGREYAEACVGRGIAVVLAPVLDVFEVGAINPGFQSRSFSSDYSVVTTFGLAMADGLRQGGVLPVVKHFPGYGAATYGPDGLLVVLNKDYGGLSRVMYPFNEAVVRGVPGVLVGHVAVPALDLEDQRRSAALSPILVNDLLRTRWKFEGVILADDVAFNSMTRALGPEAATVQALAAGCDAVLFLDPDPDRIRRVAAAVAAAVDKGELSIQQLQQSAERLNRWQEAIGNLHPLVSETPPGQIAEVPSATPIETAPPPAATPEAESVIAEAPPNQPAEVDPVPAPAAKKMAAAAEMPAPTPAVAEEVTAPPEAAPESTSQVSAPQETAPTPAPATATESTTAETVPDANAEPVATESPAPPPAPVPVETAAADAAPTPEPEETIAPSVESVAEEMPAATTDVASETSANATPDESNRSSLVHTVKEGELLSAIAEIYAVSLIDLVRWNNIETAQVDPGTQLTVYLPDGAGETAPAPPMPAETVAAAAPEEPADTAEEIVVPSGKLVHTVADGDTLSSVAQKYEVSMADITLWNGLEEAALKAGQQLTIFLDPNIAVNAEPAAPVPAADVVAETDAPETVEPKSVETAAPDSRPAHYTPKNRVIEYEVKSGDTLMKIARAYKTTADALMKLNEIADASKIFVGQKLKVPAPD